MNGKYVAITVCLAMFVFWMGVSYVRFKSGDHMSGVVDTVDVQVWLAAFVIAATREKKK